MQYARIDENGNLEYAPQNKDGILNWLNTKEKAKEEGYYPVETIEIKSGYELTGYVLENDTIKGVYEEKTNTQSYIEKRKAEYPSIEAQLDMIYWDKVYGTDIWQETISAIKAKYPEPEHVTEPIEAKEESEEVIEDGLQREEKEVVY